MIARLVSLAVVVCGAFVQAADKPPGKTKPAPTVYTRWPFDAKEATRRREETAKRLGVPLEKTLTLSKGVTMKVVLIPAGRFLMGASGKNKIAIAAEKPLHTVTISPGAPGFYLGRCEVTRGQFAAFVAETGYRTQAEKEKLSWAWKGMTKPPRRAAGLSWRKAGFPQTDEHPVVHVSWNDAKAFCDWLTRRTGEQAALPTEAQWEYACRAGTDTIFPWGDDPDRGRGWGNMADKSAKAKFPGWVVSPWSDGQVFTAPVGQYRPNAFGLHDMTGNVAEWCWDFYGKRYYSHPASALDPWGPPSGQYLIARGGCWGWPAANCRSAGRGRWMAHARIDLMGFRVAVLIYRKQVPRREVTVSVLRRNAPGKPGR